MIVADCLYRFGFPEQSVELIDSAMQFPSGLTTIEQADALRLKAIAKHPESIEELFAEAATRDPHLEVYTNITPDQGLIAWSLNQPKDDEMESYVSHIMAVMDSGKLFPHF